MHHINIVQSNQPTRQSIGDRPCSTSSATASSVGTVTTPPSVSSTCSPTVSLPISASCVPTSHASRVTAWGAKLSPEREFSRARRGPSAGSSLFELQEGRDTIFAFSACGNPPCLPCCESISHVITHARGCERDPCRTCFIKYDYPINTAASDPTAMVR